MRIRFGLLCGLSFVMAAGAIPCEARGRTITLSEYMDKLEGGWVGQMAGVTWADVTEFRFQGSIIPEDKVPGWDPSGGGIVDLGSSGDQASSFAAALKEFEGSRELVRCNPTDYAVGDLPTRGHGSGGRSGIGDCSGDIMGHDVVPVGELFEVEGIDVADGVAVGEDTSGFDMLKAHAVTVDDYNVLRWGSLGDDA